MRALGTILLASFLAAFVAAAASDPTAQPPKHVLVLYDEDKDNFPGLASTDRGLREAFESELGGAVEIQSLSMGLSRGGPGYDSRVAAFYRDKFAGSMPDLVVAVLEPPLDFLLAHAQTTFPGVPVIFCGVDAATVRGKKLPPNFTGVLVKRTFSPTLEVALKLQPDTRNVFVVGGSAPFDRYLQGFVGRDLQPFEGRVAITYLFGMPMDAMLKRLSSLPSHSVILYVTVFTDGAGRRFVPHEVVSRITATANAPVYVFLDQFVGLGAVGGNVYTTDTLGVHVAAMGREILGGASPASLSIREPPAQVDMFDARQLERWKLDEARLPSGSLVRFREPSLWELYRWYIVVVTVVLVTQAALIGGLLLARRRQRRAEAETLRQRDDLAHVLRVTTLTEMTSELAHEISQPLTSILLNAKAAIRFLARGRPADAKDVDEALADIVVGAGHASSVLERLRALFRKERVEKGPVDVTALVEDVVRLLHAAMLIERIDIRPAFSENLPDVYGDPVQLEQVLLNIVRNACDAIAARAGGPRVITIMTRKGQPGRVLIEVSDTGAGVKDEDLDRIFEHFVSTKPDGLGMGLAISRSIITAHGGLIWATANHDGGLTVHVELLACVSDPAKAQDRPGYSAVTSTSRTSDGV